MELMMLKSCISQLELSLKALSAGLDTAHESIAANQPGPFACGIDAIAIIRQGLCDLFYDEHTADGRFTPISLGLVASDSELIALVSNVNQSKSELKLACQRFQETAKRRAKAGLSTAGQSKRLRAALADLGYGRISLRQCYRHIPILDLTPHSVRFSYSSGGSSIRKLSPEAAVAVIHKLGLDSKSATVDAHRLSGLSPDTPLAQVQRLAGYYKANVFLQGEEGLEFYKTIPAFLPIFYPYTPDVKVVHQDELPESHIRPDPKRKDRKLESEPLASSVRVYAYKAEES
jgi:hypothetical protein